MSLQILRPSLCRISRVRYYATTNESKSGAKKVPRAQSCCPPDTILTGLNYLKGQEPVLALPDESYPDWLWTITTPKELPDEGPGSRAYRLANRRESKKQIKERNFMLTQ
ncbi:mitochondrial ribosomal protein L37-domain-containing protein [Mycena floridula]|nr:mitochondrial ribosomal protein L37-domain-containing protein [Mycena floridula]